MLGLCREVCGADLPLIFFDSARKFPHRKRYQQECEQLKEPPRMDPDKCTGQFRV